MCRQVVVDNNGDAMQFEIRDNYGSVQIAGNTDIDLAIVSTMGKLFDLLLFKLYIKPC
jgi:hypothetical protein